MKKKSFIIFIVLVFFVFLFLSCTSESKDSARKRNSVTFATWNVQNLFDAVDNGNEYEEYKSTAGWNDKAYRARLGNIKKVFSYFDADVVVLNEVENKDVVADIISELGIYVFYAVSNLQNSAIQIAVMSKYPILFNRIHSVQGARPVFQVAIQTPNGQVQVFAVHGKSKRDSETESKLLRQELGKVLKDVVSEEEGFSVIAGDFNEEISENNIFCDVRFGKDKGCLNVSPSYSYGVYYSPHLDPDLLFSAQGTYFYGGNWESIDNILISYSPDWKVEKADIVFKGILKNAYDQPNAYNRNLLSGVSDHLPLWIELSF